MFLFFLANQQVKMKRSIQSLMRNVRPQKKFLREKRFHLDTLSLKKIVKVN